MRASTSAEASGDTANSPSSKELRVFIASFLLIDVHPIGDHAANGDWHREEIEVGGHIESGSDQVTRAQEHIQALKDRHAGVASTEVELTGVFESLVQALPDGPGTEQRDMSLVNTRARLRMTTLYYFAALHGRLVVGTGNKVEDFGIGFYTKYGDGGVDLSPIADLMKTEVYQLGRALGVNDAILTAAPTDGLWGDDRTDEDQIGASYPELEWAMTFDGDKTALVDRQREVLAIHRRLHAANRHKMEPIPVCLIPDVLRRAD